MIQNKIPLLVFLAGILSKASCDLFRFVLIEEPKIWTEAQSFCRDKYVDLATVQSDEDRAKLKEAANAENFTSDAWIGLYLSWRWSYENTPVSYTNWAYLEPDWSNTTMACVTVNKYGKWHDEDCTGQNFFFCLTNKQDQIKDKFKYHNENDKIMNWFDAQMFCRSEKVDLATISDNTENTFLGKTIYDKHNRKAWIGLSKNLSQWYWSDQTDLSLSSVKWQKVVSNPAVKGCARANTNGLMTNDDCSIPLPFYCRENTKIHRLRVTVKSDGYLKESAVMEAIKKKMKQIFLKDKVYNITWIVQPDGKIFQQQITQENNTQDIPTSCEDDGPM